MSKPLGTSPLELVPVPVCVPVPGTTMLSGTPTVLLLLLSFGERPYWLKFLLLWMLFSLLCVVESGTGTGTALRPGHGHEFSLETAEPYELSPAEPVI